MDSTKSSLVVFKKIYAENKHYFELDGLKRLLCNHDCYVTTTVSAIVLILLNYAPQHHGDLFSLFGYSGR